MPTKNKQYTLFHNKIVIRITVLMLIYSRFTHEKKTLEILKIYPSFNVNAYEINQLYRLSQKFQRKLHTN